MNKIINNNQPITQNDVFVFDSHTNLDACAFTSRFDGNAKLDINEFHYHTATPFIRCSCKKEGYDYHTASARAHYYQLQQDCPQYVYKCKDGAFHPSASYDKRNCVKFCKGTNQGCNHCKKALFDFSKRPKHVKKRNHHNNDKFKGLFDIWMVVMKDMIQHHIH